MTYVVVSEHTLGIERPNSNTIEILHASILRGATSGLWQTTIPKPSDPTHMRPATLTDFDAFRVAPPSSLKDINGNPIPKG